MKEYWKKYQEESRGKLCTNRKKNVHSAKIYGDIQWGISETIQGKISDEIPERMLIWVPEEISKGIPEEINDGMSEEISVEISKKIPERILWRFLSHFWEVSLKKALEKSLK